MSIARMISTALLAILGFIGSVGANAADAVQSGGIVQLKVDVLGERLKREIAALQQGKPDYDNMQPALAAALKQRFAAIQGALNRLGAMKTLKIAMTASDGAHRYQVKFENGSTIWGISEDNDGKLSGLGFKED